MRSYVLVTGIAAGLIVLAHVARVVEEGMHLVRDPWWILMIIAATALCLWAVRLLAGTGSRRS
ncbi:MAG TPA: hypothetical protein VFU00_12655 [Gemmatimonadales bacterium]|nr:hypothetical protein [Gemmatimonadales bacterium]